ncbi:hypothetical protein ABVT39_026414 [Epinephelus coioides]
MDISLHPHSTHSLSAPATFTRNKAVAHSLMRTTRSKQVALHLPYLWCERRSTPEPLQPTRRLFSASSRWRFSSRKESDYGDFSPLFLSSFLSLRLSSFSFFRPLPLIQRLRFSPLSLFSSGVWKQFTDNLGQDRQRGVGEEEEGHRVPATHLAAPERARRTAGFCVCTDGGSN